MERLNGDQLLTLGVLLFVAGFLATIAAIGLVRGFLEGTEERIVVLAALPVVAREIANRRSRGGRPCSR